jgi:hypothetical protein
VLASNAIVVNASDVAAFTEKLVRGLHYRIYDAPVPEDVRVDTFVLREEAWPEHLAKVRSMTPQGVPPGFLFWRGVAAQEPMFAIWYFLIWGQIFLQASTTPPNADADPLASPAT